MWWKHFYFFLSNIEFAVLDSYVIVIFAYKQFELIFQTKFNYKDIRYITN